MSFPRGAGADAAGVIVVFDGAAIANDGSIRKCVKEERPPRGCCLCCCLCGGEDGFDEDATPPRGKATMQVGRGAFSFLSRKKKESRSNDDGQRRQK